MTSADLSRTEWHKSSYSSQDGNCVEVGTNLPGAVAIRDSPNPGAPMLLIPAAGWRTFLTNAPGCARYHPCVSRPGRPPGLQPDHAQ